MNRAVRLSLLLMRRSPTRAIMLVILLSVAIVVFALVAELSRVSKEGIDEAIVRDSGQRGSYTVSFDPSLRIPPQLQYEMVQQVATSLNLTVWAYWEDMPAVKSECPPYERIGEQSLRVLWKRPGVPFDLPFGKISGIDTQWCIGGQGIPAQALFAPDQKEQGVFGAKLYIRSEYQQLVELSTLGDIKRGFTVLSGHDMPMETLIKDGLIERAKPAVALVGVDPDSNLQVTRSDNKGQQTRHAADGLGVTYNVIGWGTIVLAGLAVVVIQTSHIRQRLWFYGLLQSFGATNRRLAGILLADGIAVIAVGTALALGVLRLGQNAVYEFARSAFGVHANVLSAELLPRLLVGLAVILAMSTVIPLTHALRRDPLDVLEAPRD